MPWAVAAAAVGAAGTAYSANKAAGAQEDAANQANAVQQANLGATVQRNAPFYGAGTDALTTLQQKLPGLNTGYDPQALLSEPGYQFGLQQGQKALENSLAARGRSVSGAALKAADEFGTNYATSKLGDAFQRDQAAKGQQFSQLMQLTGLGQASANNTSAAGQNYANNVGANTIGAGNSAAAADLAQGNIWSGLINQGVSAYGRMNNQAVAPGTWQSTGGGTAGFGTGTAFGNQDMGQYLADGGPVRSEPRVGTRAAPPAGGTGGGMSREAILAALDAAHAQAQAGGIAALPTNPVMNPGGITAGRMQPEQLAGGGAVRGPGGPKDDVVPVMASNGEHMFDADSVTALGDGDNERGQALLNEMRERIKAHAAGKTRKH